MKVFLYHANCTDGLFSAYSLWKAFGNDALYIPVNYKPIQDQTPEEALQYIFNFDLVKNPEIANNSYHYHKRITEADYADIELYVVDYSFPVDHFKHHTEVFNSVLVLDHHHTAFDAYKTVYDHHLDDNGWANFHTTENSQVIFSHKESGCKLAWMFFHKDKVPDYIEYVSDRDLWTFKLKKSEIFHAGVNGLGLKVFSSLDSHLLYALPKIISVGTVILDDKKRRIQNVKNSSVITVKLVINDEEYSCALVNSPPEMASDLCSSVLSDGNHQIAISYYITKEGKVACSVRSIKSVDSSIFSLYYGGGGHKQASGCTVDTSVFFASVEEKLWRINYG